MFDDSHAFLPRAFLRAEFDLEYRVFCGDGSDAVLRDRLKAWAGRSKLKETQAESAFLQTFFVETWGYGEAGRVPPEQQTLFPKWRVEGEGAGGGQGEADAALGWFRGQTGAIPQVLCEFKDIRSKLDARQNRKGSTRTPVEQALNYVRGARRGLVGNEPVQPWWAFVSDMNEFRLYWWDRAPDEYLRFVIQQPPDLFAGQYDLLSDRDEARFDRFLFQKLFGRDFLISPAGRPPLLRLIDRQWAREKKLEKDFYKDYRETRERLFNAMRVSNPGFPGTPSELLRLAQVLLDRFIFVFFCEDMGQRMRFPPQLFTDFLKGRSTDLLFDPNGREIWDTARRLFDTMNTGGKLGPRTVPHVNGGLFALNPALDALHIPNEVFAAPGQGTDDDSLESDKRTFLYLGGRYNYAAQGEAREALSLYTLGRIFEQSITELDYRTGELEGRDSIAKLSKRKRNGVYYTPEWVVNLLVEETLGPWFKGAQRAVGFPEEGDPSLEAAQAYAERLQTFRVVDPACGSGAFLISAFRRVLRERLAAQREVERLLAKAGGGNANAVPETAMVADVLLATIFGVDINPASVEIAKLALWLHSARPDAPLSSLDGTIRCGNSLVGPNFWAEPGRDETDVQARERVNAFDWHAAFPGVWPAGEEGGFDAVLGNPPYVKMQNMMGMDADTMAYLRAPRGDVTFRSAQTGNTDLYLPFIEQGLRLLAPGGRMAFIAPNLWPLNDYGEGLRRLVRDRRQLERWLDFRSHQIFSDVTIYTALQFFTREPNDIIRIAFAPQGDEEALDVDWSDPTLAVPYSGLPTDGSWLMATGEDRAVIERLWRDHPRLGDRRLTSAVFQGLGRSDDLTI